MKILLAVDHSTYSEAALQAIIKQLRTENTEVAIVHVMEVSLADFGSRQTFEINRAERLKTANALVERFAAALKDAGYSPKPMVEEGDARDAILGFAERWKPDVIFVGAHGRRRFRRPTLGSVSEAVVRHANCSVEIVRAAQNA
jgi:nucleotide-binding universal stress UspA family protein